MDTSDYDFKLVFPSISVGTPSVSDATFFNQKIFTGNLESVDYYRADVNFSNQITITDIYSIYQRTHGYPWKSGIPTHLYFSEADWSNIQNSSANLRSSIPGFQSIVINNAITSDTTNARLVKVGFKN